MPKRKHPVWEHFKCITNKNTGLWAICKTCNKEMQGIPYRMVIHRQKCEIENNAEHDECEGSNHSEEENRDENTDNLQPDRELEVKVEDIRINGIHSHDKQQHLKTARNSFAIVQSSKDRGPSKKPPESSTVIKIEDDSEDETPPHVTTSNSNKRQELDETPPILIAQETRNSLPLLPIQEPDNTPPQLPLQRLNGNLPHFAAKEADDRDPVVVVQNVNACGPVPAAVQSLDDCHPPMKRQKLAEESPQSQPERQGKNNDCDLFGEYISGKMKQFDYKTRCVVQYLMSNILFQADMGRFQEGNFDCQSLIGFHPSNKNSKSSL